MWHAGPGCQRGDCEHGFELAGAKKALIACSNFKLPMLSPFAVLEVVDESVEWSQELVHVEPTEVLPQGTAEVELVERFLTQPLRKRLPVSSTIYHMLVADPLTLPLAKEHLIVCSSAELLTSYINVVSGTLAPFLSVVDIWCCAARHKQRDGGEQEERKATRARSGETERGRFVATKGQRAGQVATWGRGRKGGEKGKAGMLPRSAVTPCLERLLSPVLLVLSCATHAGAGQPCARHQRDGQRCIAGDERV